MRNSQKIGAVGMVIWLSLLPAGVLPQPVVELGQWHIILSGDDLAAARYAIGADMYRAGDAAAAVPWMQQAAEQGLPEAQTHFGALYAYGRGVTQDDAEAVRWYRLAAEQGYAPARTALGYMHQDGRGVTQDDAEAARWYRLAAEQGNADAQNNLGALYADGRGVQRDVVAAFAWFSVAALQGQTAAETNMLGLVDDMTRTEIILARAMTADIQRRHAHANTTAESPQ